MNRLFKDSSIFVFSSLISAAVPFLLLPILTKYLTPNDYGLLTVFLTLSMFIAPIMGWNTDAVIQKKFFDGKDELNNYISSSIIITFLLLIIFSSTIYFLRVEKIFGLSLKVIFLTVIYCYSQIFVNMVLIIFQVTNKAIKFGTIQFSNALMNSGISVALVVGYEMSYVGRIMGYVVTTVIMGLICFIYILIKYKPLFIPTLYFIKETIKFGGGLIPHTIGHSLIIMSSRYFIIKFENTYQLGIFFTSVQICSIMILIFTAINNAFVPWLFDKLNKNDYHLKQKITGNTYKLFIFMILFVIIFNLFIPYVIQLLDKSYHSAIDYIIPISIACLFQGFYFAVANYINYTGKTYYQSICTIFSGLIGVLYNYILIKYFGVFGGAIALAMTYLTLFVFTWIISSKIYSMPWLKPRM